MFQYSVLIGVIGRAIEMMYMLIRVVQKNLFGASLGMYSFGIFVCFYYNHLSIRENNIVFFSCNITIELKGGGRDGELWNL